MTIIEGEFEVIGGAMGGGGSPPPPRTPVTAPDSLRSLSILELVEGLCEGEIEGFATVDPLESIELNDTPLKTNGEANFEGISVDYRLGTQAQTYIPGSLDNATASLVGVDIPITFNAPRIQQIENNLADAIRINIVFTALVKQDATTGDKKGVTVEVGIHIRINQTGSWIPVSVGGREIVSGKTESPYERSFLVDLTPWAGATTYEVRVSRISPDPAQGETSEFKWVSYTILNYAKLRYPNTAVCRITFDAKSFSSIPVRSFNLKGLKIKVPGPSVYNPVTRTYTGTDWDGNFTVAWSRNPAWILYDLVTNPRYGLGELVNPIYQDKWSIFTIAKRCDELVLDGKGGMEPRYSLDLYIQSAESAKKVVQDIASVFDGMAYWGNKAVIFTQDSPKAVTKLFTPANVVKGQFNYTGSARQVRKTVALIQWNDPDDNYRVATEYVEDTSGLIRYGYQETAMVAIGCTSRGQAHRYGKRLLLTSRLETDAIAFSVGLDALTLTVGERFRVADPLKNDNITMGGRLIAGSTTQFITLDRSITLASGINYKIALINSLGEVITGTVINLAGSHNVIEVSPLLAGIPETDTVFIVYNEAELDRTYRVVSITETSSEDKTDGFYSITGVEYNANKYSEIDDIHDLPELPPNPFINTSVVPPSGLQVSTGVYTALEGIRRYIDLSWSASTSQFISHYLVIARLNGETVIDDKAYEQNYRILNPLVGDWEFTVSTVTSIGKYSTSITVQYTLGEIYLVESVSVTGLSLVGGGTTFSGRSIELDWDTDALTVLGFSDTYGSGQGGQSPWFRDYQVDIYDGVTLLRSDFVTESKYTYTYDKNLEDGGPRRTITAKVRARDLYGRYSQMAQITVSNPAPSAINTVSVFAGYKSLVISYVRPPDNDWVGVVVFLSETTGFTPDALNLIYVGTDTTITIPNLLEDTPYFIRIGAYDAFGGDTDYTLTPYEYTKTITSVSLPSPEEIKNGLQTALDSAVDPLIFNTDAFAININGISKTPFIIGAYQGNPAILMDADVVVTGAVSADQLVGGRVAATEDIIIGEGNARINGNGSIFVYNGPDTVNNRDFAVLSGGTLSFQRYRGGQYYEYKSVRRVEYGQAPSGATIELPGYWDAQPRIIVTPASLRSYDATYPSSSQTWTVRADNLEEIPEDGTILVDTQLNLILLGNANIGTDYASKAAGTDNWDTQAYSSIGTDNDCWVSFKFDSNIKHAMCGLNKDPQANASFDSLDYAIYGMIDTTFKVYEGGVDRGSFGNYTSSDVFKVERTGTTVNYQKNGVTFRSITVPVGEILYVDSSFFTIGAGINTIQFWNKQAPAGSGSGRWKFDAVAELNYASSSGVNTVASNSGNLNVDSWYSAESVLPNGTVSITVSARFQTYRGNGTSTYGFLYRSVSWTIQGWDGGAWINLATKVRNIAAAEHNMQLTDSQSTNIPTGISKIRGYFVAYDTNGASYSLGADVYTEGYTSITLTGTTGTTITNSGSSTVTTPEWSPPFGQIYQMRYRANMSENIILSIGTIDGYFYAEGALVMHKYLVSGNSSGASWQSPYDSGYIYRNSYNRQYFSFSASSTGGNSGSGNPNRTVFSPTVIEAWYHQLNANSATPDNNFTLQDYSWQIAGSTAIAEGSLNWMAIGD